MRTLGARSTHEQIVKRSRFNAFAEHVESADAALAWLAENFVAEASHNCWAYRIGSAYRFSDDGEPSGTAGRPILAAIEGSTLDHVIVVVARWFGGIKLGAGGLVRAYGGTAAACLGQAAIVTITPTVELRLNAGFEHAGMIHGLVGRFDASIIDEAFGPSGIAFTISVKKPQAPEFAKTLQNQSRGQVQISFEDPR